MNGEPRNRELKTGQMAQLNGVSEKTLRLYQEKGIFLPRSVNEETGFRYYSIDQCSDLDTIRKLSGIGFTLSEIGELCENQDPASLSAALTERIAELEARRRRIDQSILVAQSLLRSCDAKTRPPIVDQIILEQIPERPIVSAKVPLEFRRHHSESDQIEWELTLRMLRKEISDLGIPSELFNNAGCTIGRQSLVERTFEVESAFVFIDETLARDLDAAKTLPQGQYLTMYREHSFDESGSSTVFETLERMLDYAEAKGMAVGGDYYDEIIAGGSMFGYRGCDCFIKLHLPVSSPGSRA